MDASFNSAKPQPRSLEAFCTGTGVAWGDHDGRLHCGSAALYRNGYRGSLVSRWLPALDGVVERLESGITVADVGCGHAHSTVLMAQAFPRSRFHGFDVHPASIEGARCHAAEAGVAGRVSFEVAQAVDYPDGQYGLTCVFDCLHDMGDPVAVACYARQVLAPDGTVMLVEPFARDRVEENRSPVARLYYAASTTICCAHAISEGGELVLGAQAGEARLAQVFRSYNLGSGYLGPGQQGLPMPVARGVDQDLAAVFVPFRQDRAMDRSRVQLEVMLRGSVGVAVDEPAGHEAAQVEVDGPGVDVHDLGRLFRGGGAAFAPVIRRHGPAALQGLPQKQASHQGVADAPAEALVGDVVRAQ